MKKAFRVALVASVALVAVGPAQANHRWGNYHWARTANPLVLKINESLTSNWDSYLVAAMVDWNQSTVINFTSANPSPSSIGAKKCTAIRGQILVCNSAYGQRGWLGIASIWASGDHITQATVKMNDSYFNTAAYNTPDWRQFVMCQEVGHDFGLDHQDENFSNANLGTCMDYTNNPSTNTEPNAHDYAELEAMYAHGDSTNTATQSSATNFGVRAVGNPPGQAAGDEASGDSPAEWGRAIRRDGLGRPNVYLKELGNGRRKITHVFWAIGEGPQN